MERALGYDELVEEHELDRITRRLRRPVDEGETPRL